MSDSGDRGQRPEGARPSGSNSSGSNRGGRPGNAGPSTGRPAASGRPSKPRDGHAPRAGAGRGKPDEERRLWTKGGAPARGDSSARERELPEDRDPFNIRSVRAHHDAPDIPDDVRDSDLDRVARNELKTLDTENAEGVARHLVMAARLIEEDPQLAHSHAISAARRAGRIGIVRETLAITAYAIEDYALALRELRTYRRITGRDDQLPMMVDSERGLGRPEKALELGRSVKRSTLPVPVQVELAIAMSGARLDLEQVDAALVELEISQLDPTKAFSYSPNLFAAYATVLEELGRAADAKTWYQRADDAADALDAAGYDEESDTIEVVEEDFDVEPSESEDEADVPASDPKDD